MKRPISAGKIIKITLHLIAWSILLGLNYYFMHNAEVGKDFIWMYYINTIIGGLIFYINYFILVPRYYFIHRRLKYFLSIAAMILFFYAVSNVSGKLVLKYVPGKFTEMERVRSESVSQSESESEGESEGKGEAMERRNIEMRQPVPPPPGTREFIRPPFRRMFFVSFSFSSFFLVFFSLGLRIIERQDQIEKERKELEGEKLKAELALLKNQISPHFFFNTLNNIYSLIGINQEDSKKAVLQLSKMMRYLLYESEQGATKLSSEIEFMNNYIELMKLRVSEKIDLAVKFPDKYSDHNIPPLLFIPFIENAFKHGVTYRGKSFIEIELESDNDTVIFRCRNSIPDTVGEGKEKNAGIGLENIKRRLNLLFPDKHELKINRSGNEFNVFLKIQID